MEKNKKEENYFLSLEEMKNEKGNFSFLSENGVFLGEKNGKRIIENSKENLIIFNNDNFDCNSTIILPTLLKTWKGSVIISDYNGEIYNETSGIRKEKMNNKILQLDLDFNFFCNYNPFEEVRIMSEYEMEDIKNIVYPIFEKEFKNQKKTGNLFYFEDAAIMLINIIYYELYRKFLKNPKFKIENNKKIPISYLTFKDIISFFNNSKTEFAIKYLLNLKNENTIEEYGKDEKTKEYVRKKINNINTLNIKGNKENYELIKIGKLPKFYKYLNSLQFNSEISLICYFNTAKTILNDFEKMFDNKKNLSSKSNFRLFDLMNCEKPVSLYLTYNKKNIEISKIFYKILLNQFIEKNITKDCNFELNCLININNTDFFANYDNSDIFLQRDKIINKIKYINDSGIKLIINFESFKQFEKIFGINNKILNNFRFKIEKVNKMKSDKILINSENLKPLLLDPVYYYNDSELKKLSEI